MWWYGFSHVVFHFIRWFPKDNRVKVRVIIILFSFALLFPQLFVLTRDHSSRYCGQHLFDQLIVSIVFTFCMIAFTIIFTLMDPVPFEVKVMFHIFGGMGFILGLVLSIFTSMAVECQNNTVELYYMSLASVILCLLTMVFFVLMLPFWLLNRWFTNSVLDKKGRTGLCYEPTECCSCLWHI
ncbi:uncharacterized protein LOC117302306 [Asterias rubens]|uniref:uncharacterized protein LOC117302306 n=1 Tax=Asterias rubens TaxID=7604 RepID=UPI001455C233|nr:uncharacterized protein LOC117302306 [Asterias rubens]XP_033642088.1 uncharacterized protein LOC117302306 [Asterias rubens]XP_033642089.1 uncharacterized protein LOC117302306 [Asterias rubens]